MIAFSDPVELARSYPLNGGYSSGDLACVGDVVVVGWSIFDDELLNLRAVHAVTRELGPELTISPGDNCWVTKMIDVDAVVWMSVQTSAEVRLARVSVDQDTLELSLEWMASVPTTSNYDTWLMRYRNRIILATNCGNPDDPSDPSNQLLSQLYMFDFDGTLIDKKPGIVQSGFTYTEWFDVVTVNPWTSQLLGVSAIYSGGYQESAWTMPITEAGFGTWTRGPNLYNDWAWWAVAIGTPGGWHVMTVPNGPRYAEVLTLDTSLNRRGSAVLVGYPADNFKDREHSKNYGITLRNGRVAYSAHRWGYDSPGDPYGLFLGYGPVDSSQPLTEVTIIPKTDDVYVDYQYLARVVGTPDGWMYLSAGQIYDPRHIRNAFRHYVWGASLEAGHFPEADEVVPDDARASFRGVLR